MSDHGPGKDSDTFAVRMSWVGFEDEPVQVTNQFVSQFDRRMFFISFGLLTPPLLLGTNEERRAQAERIEFLPVETLSRVAVTPEGMRALVSMLQENLERFETKYGPVEDSEEGDL